MTVEAGRPDTLSAAKIKLLADAGVGRICINPQTMVDDTLRTIGRQHDRRQIIDAVAMAREKGLADINMDIIVGLPGEDLQDNLYTGRELLKLRPENITVHSLAVKRGSRMAEKEGLSGVGDKADEVAAGINALAELFAENGYEPYYLYRQKYMKANMENIGYSLPGHYCLYNIQVMEERQTIVALGGGAASKFVDPGDWTLTSFHNPKDPPSYCQNVERLIQRKVDKLLALN
jgi:oxygen-independent coproporphyrinogen-3 oxidase